jgi:hypothetical protein
MSIFSFAFKTVQSLRKNDIRSDIHVVAPTKKSGYDLIQLRSIVQGFLLAATARSLDVIGLVSDWLLPGQIAQEIAREKNIDVKVLPGQELVSAEGLNIIALNISKEIEQRLPWKKMLEEVHKQKGISIVIQPTRRWIQRINTVSKEPWAPDGVEAYNEHYSLEYIDLDVNFEYEFFMGSGATNPAELQNSKVNTKTKRTWWVQKGVLAQEEGLDFEPNYLKEWPQYGIR